MIHRSSLRRRVALAFAGLGAALSLLLTLGIWAAAHDVSRRLIDQTLKAELEDYMARRARNPHSIPPATVSIRGYVLAAGSSDDEVPAALRNLADGQHEIELEGTPYRVAVDDHNGDRYFILFNEERQKLRERRFFAYLIGGAVVMTLLASIGGLWLAGRVIAPVSELAAAVAAATPETPPGLSEQHQSDDEIAELARAFDGYHARLAAFVERERAFADDASHELRTPLTIMRGAAEVLADDPALTPAQAGRIARIQRAAEHMSELIAALLLLAREETMPVEDTCDAAQIVRDCLDRHATLAKSRGTTLSLEAPAPVHLPVPAAMFAIVVANLVHNAVVHTENGRIVVRLDDGRMTVADTGTGICASEIEKVFGRHYRGSESPGAGIGLALVKRVCDRHGWRIDLHSTQKGTVATLHFGGQ